MVKEKIFLILIIMKLSFLNKEGTYLYTYLIEKRYILQSCRILAIDLIF